MKLIFGLSLINSHDSLADIEVSEVNGMDPALKFLLLVEHLAAATVFYESLFYALVNDLKSFFGDNISLINFIVVVVNAD